MITLIVITLILEIEFYYVSFHKASFFCWRKGGMDFTPVELAARLPNEMFCKRLPSWLPSTRLPITRDACFHSTQKEALKQIAGNFSKQPFSVWLTVELESLTWPTNDIQEDGASIWHMPLTRASKTSGVKIRDRGF